MCYDIKASLEAQLKRAKRYNNVAAILEIEQKLIPFTDLPMHHKSGFSHPKALIYPNLAPNYPMIAHWGLVPHWVKDKQTQQKIWNNTINARSETMFTKPSFRDSAKNRRCLVFVDGFYEHHHFNGKTYPFYIHASNNQPLCLAGLWSEWIDTQTGEVLASFSVLTTQGNSMMAKIHNNPKLKEARMPVILEEKSEHLWLSGIADSQEEQNRLLSLCQPASPSHLQAYTVTRLRGSAYPGNIPEINKPVNYPELVY